MPLSLKGNVTSETLLTDPSEYKKSLRREFTEKRRLLTDTEKKIFSERLCEKVCSLDVFKKADAVLSFYPLPLETDVRTINAEVLRLGKTLLLPRCIHGTREMDFYEVRVEEDLEKGSFSITEPKRTCPLFIPSGEEKTLCIVPAMAYDREGFRLGYGGGYYDRYLSRFDLETVGVAYHPFLTDALPRGEYDRAVDTVVTDREIITVAK